MKRRLTFICLLLMCLIANIVGHDAFRKLHELNAGRYVYIPTRAKPDHWLAELLGIELLEKLVSAASGTRSYIPRTLPTQAAAAKQALQDRNANIYTDWLKNGFEVSDLSRKYDLSQSRIWAIISSLKQENFNPRLLGRPTKCPEDRPFLSYPQKSAKNLINA